MGEQTHVVRNNTSSATKSSRFNCQVPSKYNIALFAHSIALNSALPVILLTTQQSGDRRKRNFNHN